MSVLRENRVFLDAPCGGSGKCGKCGVLLDGQEALACQTAVERDMTVTIPDRTGLKVLQRGIAPVQRMDPLRDGYQAAFDIGTTSVVCFLLDGVTGVELAKCSMLNPQTAFGADVISRIQAALRGELERETEAIRTGMTALLRSACSSAGVDPGKIGVVSVAGNPAMQQLFFGIHPGNLAAVPFAPALTEAKTVPCKDILPICPNADLLLVPDISGYIGADTLGCVLSTGLYQSEEITLMVDIGTNGEMVLGNKNRMIACSAAAGPALEGANIQFGMRGTVGAVDHVRLKNGRLEYSVIGGGEAAGICGSGLIDAVAAGLEMGLLNKRGRIQNDGHIFHITEHIWLTQNDIRQVQLAKGAIYAGILLMAKQLGLEIWDIRKVQLAGAFGSFLDPKSACRIGLLPAELLDRIEAVGNAAGSGAKLLAGDRKLLPLTQALAEKIEFLELASLPEFPRTFAKSMNFREEPQ
ncbi:MAG: ASKHA domain-containing protein [Butyricicoccus sp.]|nr:ASKHA domain-containing protein [Butyricicoccus sp.]